jgi:mono/diheme cytochrome c family protein
MKALYATAGVLALAIVGTGFWWINQADDRGGPIVSPSMHGAAVGAAPMAAEDITVPELSAAAMQGRAAFDKNCATCHGRNATGTDKGPPLVHPIYEPSHHADLAFLLAARNGVRAHHWRFGNMPPVEGVTDGEIEWIVAYVRELQRANGIR